MIDALMGIGLIVLAGIVGVGAVRRILGSVSVPEVISMGFPIGAGLWTWLLFLASWAGASLNRGWILAVLLALMLAIWLPQLISQSSRRGEAAVAATSGSSGLVLTARWALIVALVLFFLAAAMVSVGRAHSAWDTAAGWATKGYGIVTEGTILAGAKWGAWGLAYPLNVPLQYGIFYAFGTESLPASKLIFPVYLLSVLGSVFVYWRRSEVPESLAGLAALLLVSNPLLFRHGTIGYANLPLAAYLVPGVLWSVTGVCEGNRRFFLLGGLLIGLGGWTRPEALAYVLALFTALVVGIWITRRWKPSRRGLIYWLAPVGTIVGSWYLFGWTNVLGSHLGGAMSGALADWLAGNFRLYELHLIPRLLAKRALILNRWGVLFPVSAALLILGIDKLVKFRSYVAETTLALMTASAAVVPMGVFYVRAFTRPGQEFIGLLHRSFDRSFLPAAILIFTWAVVMAFSARESVRVETGTERTPEGEGLGRSS